MLKKAGMVILESDFGSIQYVKCYEKNKWYPDFINNWTPDNELLCDAEVINIIKSQNGDVSVEIIEA